MLRFKRKKNLVVECLFTLGSQKLSRKKIERF